MPCVGIWPDGSVRGHINSNAVNSRTTQKAHQLAYDGHRSAEPMCHSCNTTYKPYDNI